MAIQALGFIGGDPERLGAFLTVTGIGPAQIRASAQDPHFMAGVLEYLAGDEKLLLEFSEHSEIDPVTVMFALEALGGRRQGDGDA